jgi:hypothetical protein
MYALGGPLEIVQGVFTDPDSAREINVDYPRVEIRDGSGRRLYTVLEDPEGHQAYGVPTPTQHENRVQADQQALLARMETEIQLLRDQVNRQASGLNPPTHVPYTPLSESELPVDDAPDPTTVSPPQRPSDNLDWATAAPQSKPGVPKPTTRNA